MILSRLFTGRRRRDPRLGLGELFIEAFQGVEGAEYFGTFGKIHCGMPDGEAVIFLVDRLSFDIYFLVLKIFNHIYPWHWQIESSVIFLSSI